MLHGSPGRGIPDGPTIQTSLTSPEGAITTIKKMPMAGGAPVEVRNETATGPAPAPDGQTLYYLKVLEPVNGLWDYELRVAHPETGASQLLARISGHRVPDWQGLHPVLSPNAKWLVFPLNDRLGTNLWLLSTTDGKPYPATISAIAAPSSPGVSPGLPITSMFSRPLAKETST